MNIKTIIVISSFVLAISSCTTTPKPVTVSTIPVEIIVNKQPAPREVKLNDPKFYVVTAANFEEFKARYTVDNKEFLFYALSPDDFQKILVNQSELKRYIAQQKSVIVYYEEVTKAK